MSFLNELYHFNLNGYPGNPPCDIPAFDDETPVFDGTYLVHMGDDINNTEYQLGVDGIAEYLFASTLTRCGGFFNACRNTQEFEPGMLKTMCLSSICQGHGDLSDKAADDAIQELFSQWFEEGRFASRSVSTDTVVNSILSQTPLEPDSLEKTIFSLVQENLGVQPENLLLQQVITGLQERPAHQYSQLAYTDKLLTDAIGEPAPDRKNDRLNDVLVNPKLCEFMEPRIPNLAHQIQLQISDLIVELIDQPDFRISGANAVLKDLIKKLEQVELDLEYRREKHWTNYEGAEDRLEAMLEQKDCPLLPEEATVSSVTEMVTDRLRYVIEAYKRKLVRFVRYELRYAIDRVDEYRANVNVLWEDPNNVRVRRSENAISNNTASLHQLLQEFSTHSAISLIDFLATRIEEKVLLPEGGLRLIIEEGGNRARALPKLIKHEAQMMINEELKKLQLDSLIIDSGLPSEIVGSSVQDLVNRAKPLLYNCGGTARLLIGVPSNAPIATLSRYIEDSMKFEANVIPSTFGDFFICVEMDRVPSENVAMSLLHLQPDCAELVERLHCRTDVEWSNLTTMV